MGSKGRVQIVPLLEMLCKLRVEQLVAILSDERKATFQSRREKMLSEKIDCAKFLTYFIENYPDSVAQTKNADKGFWEKFK